MSALALKFESISPDKHVATYATTNENVGTIHDLIKGKDIKRAAGICSGGEIGFFSMLPHVKEELILVDHSFKNMTFALTKYLLIAEFGWAKTRRLFTPEQHKELASCVAKVK